MKINGAKPLSKPMLIYSLIWTLGWYLYWINLFIESAFLDWTQKMKTTQVWHLLKR